MYVKCFRDLKVWQLSKEIVVDVYQITKNFPQSEQFGITNQLRRASVSVPSNISEGFNRFQKNEYRRFLYIALGSCAELETQVEISFDLNFINQEVKCRFIDKINHVSRMLTNLIKTLN